MSISVTSAFGSGEDNFGLSDSSLSSSSSSSLSAPLVSAFTCDDSSNPFKVTSQSPFTSIVFAPATSSTQSSFLSSTQLSTDSHSLRTSCKKVTKRPAGLTNIIIPDNISNQGSSIETRYQNTKRTMSEVEQEIKKQIYKYRSISCDIKHSPVVHVDEHKVWDDKIHKHLARIMKELESLQKTLVEFKQYTHHR